MPTGETKGITVRIDAELHAEIKAYLEAHEMTMGEFVALAAEDEMHPQNLEKENKSMENMRTLAFQVPEDLFQRIKDYLRRNNMTQKQFVIGLIEDELERDEALLQSDSEIETPDENEGEDSAFGLDEGEPGLNDTEALSEETDGPEYDEAQEGFSDEDSNVSADDFEADNEDESEDENLGIGQEI